MEKTQGMNQGNALMDSSGKIRNLGKYHMCTRDTSCQGSANIITVKGWYFKA